MSDTSLTDFSDPQIAVDHFEAHRDAYDAVALDMVMPALSGKEVFRMFRTIRGNVPVVL